MIETIIIGSTATIDLHTPKIKTPYFIEGQLDGFQNIIFGYSSVDVKIEEVAPVLTTISGGEIPYLELYPANYPEKQIEPVLQERLHKQPRGYLKTMAALVGRDRSNMTEGNVEAYERKTIPRLPAITGNLLLQLWQREKHNDGWLFIRNLSKVAKILGTNSHRLKEYFVLLGGYKYPIITYSDNNSLIVREENRLFDMRFDCNTSSFYPQDSMIGTRYLSFPKGKYVKGVLFRPTSETREQIEGNKKTMGNIMVSDRFVPFCLDLSNMAYKLLCFTASNEPSGKYRFDTIMQPKFLNLERQLKNQGKARLLESIREAFHELGEKGHFKEWGYNDEKDMFTWGISNLIIKHPRLMN